MFGLGWRHVAGGLLAVVGVVALSVGVLGLGASLVVRCEPGPCPSAVVVRGLFVLAAGGLLSTLAGGGLLLVARARAAP